MATTQTYAALAANIAAIEKLGNWISQSQMFGVTNIAQAMIIASDLFITGMPLLEYQKRNDMVSGRPSKPYDAMIAELQQRGGKLKVLEKSPEATRIEITYQGNVTPFVLTWEELKKEPTPYQTSRDLSEAKVIDMLAKGEQPPLKAKYATPRSRAIMIYARCVSDAIRTVAAEVNFGTYTPEEIEDFSENNTPVAVAPERAAPHGQAVTAAGQITSQPEPAVTTAAAPAATVEPAKVDTPAADTGSGTTAKFDGPATAVQKKAILEKLMYLKQEGMSDIDDRVSKRIKECGIAGGILGLTLQEADILYKSLEKKELEQFFNLQLQGHAKN